MTKEERQRIEMFAEEMESAAIRKRDAEIEYIRRRAKFLDYLDESERNSIQKAGAK